MAIKDSELPVGSALDGSELWGVSQSSISSGLSTVKVALSTVKGFVISSVSSGLSSVSSGLSNNVSAISANSSGLSNTNSSISAISSGLRLVNFNQQSGNYTFALTDVCTISADVLVQGTSSSGQTFTVPTNASVSIPVGAVILGEQDGTGQITIAAASGVTINTPSLTTRAQYSPFVLIKKATDTWLLSGDLT